VSLHLQTDLLERIAAALDYHTANLMYIMDLARGITAHHAT